MEIRIFDVERGFCALVIADNGNVVLVDCGQNQATGFMPSDYLPANGCGGIELFIVSNYDEDHLSDLPRLCQRLPIQIVHRNGSITADQLRTLKLRAGPILPGVESLLNTIGTYTKDVAKHPEFPDIEFAFFCNNYPMFEDTNNLSLVTFLHYHGLHIIFPGDLEEAGWRALLNQQPFINHLGRVNLFVASQHGRESGYCAEIFEYCQPELVIIPEESIQYETQETVYQKHATGMQVGDSRRYVLSTHSAGMITIHQRPGGSPLINTAR